MKKSLAILVFLVANPYVFCAEEPEIKRQKKETIFQIRCGEDLLDLTVPVIECSKLLSQEIDMYGNESKVLELDENTNLHPVLLSQVFNLCEKYKKNSLDVFDQEPSFEDLVEMYKICDFLWMEDLCDLIGKKITKIVITYPISSYDEIRSSLESLVPKKVVYFFSPRVLIDMYLKNMITKELFDWTDLLGRFYPDKKYRRDCDFRDELEDDDENFKVFYYSTYYPIFKKLRTYENNSGKIAFAGSIDAEGLTSVVSESQSIKIYSYGQNISLRSIEYCGEQLRSAQFSHDKSLLVTSSEEHSAKVWDLASKSLLYTLPHDDDLRYATFSPDSSMIISCSEDNTAKLWDSKSGSLLAVLKAHSDDVNWAVFNPSSSIVVTVSDDKTAIIWDLASMSILKRLTGHTDWIYSADINADGTLLLTSSQDKTVKVWDIASGTLRASLNGHSDYVRSVIFNPDGSSIVSASKDRRVKIWSSKDYTLLQRLPKFKSSVKSVSFSEDGQTLITLSGNEITLWQAYTL